MTMPSCREIVRAKEVRFMLLKQTSLNSREADLVLDMAIKATDDAMEAMMKSLQLIEDIKLRLQTNILAIQFIEHVLDRQMVITTAVIEKLGGDLVNEIPL